MRSCRENSLLRRSASDCSARLDLMIREIATQRSRRAALCGQRNIAVRPDKVHRITREARALMVLAPRKDVQRHIVSPAPGREIVLGRAINVNLPFHAGEWFE